MRKEGAAAKKRRLGRNLTARDESQSVNEKDGWVFDDLDCDVLEEESIRRSIRRQIHCMRSRTD